MAVSLTTPRFEYLQHPLAGIWTGVTVLPDDQLVIIDTATRAAVEQTILPALRQQKLMDGRSVLVINTHCHCDHIGGNHGLREALNVTIAAHRMDAPFVADRRAQFEALFGAFNDDPDLRMQWAGFHDLAGEDTPVDVVLDEGILLDTGSRSLRVMHTPGHSAGSITLFDEGSGILFAGDAAQCDGTTATGVPLIVDVVAYRVTIEKLRAIGAHTLVLDHPFKPYRSAILHGVEVEQFLLDCLIKLDRFAATVDALLAGQRGATLTLREIAQHLVTTHQTPLNPYVCMLAAALLEERIAAGTAERRSGQGCDPSGIFVAL